VTWQKAALRRCKADVRDPETPEKGETVERTRVAAKKQNLASRKAPSKRGGVRGLKISQKRT